jgi:hypothetical protein
MRPRRGLRELAIGLVVLVFWALSYWIDLGMPR